MPLRDDMEQLWLGRVGRVSLGYRAWSKCPNSNCPSRQHRWPGWVDDPNDVQRVILDWRQGQDSVTCPHCKQTFPRKQMGIPGPIPASHFVFHKGLDPDVPDPEDYYGKLPKKIMVRFIQPHDFSAYYEMYLRQGMRCKGDGVRVLKANPCEMWQKGERWQGKSLPGPSEVYDGMVALPGGISWDGTHFEYGAMVPCPGRGEAGRYERCTLCGRVIRLNFLLSGAYPMTLRQWGLSTGSRNAHRRCLLVIPAMTTLIHQLGGSLIQVPFELMLSMDTVPYQDKDGSWKQREMPLLEISPPPLYLDMMLVESASRLVVSEQRRSVMALESGGEVPDEVAATDAPFTEDLPPTVATVSGTAQGPDPEGTGLAQPALPMGDVQAAAPTFHDPMEFMEFVRVAVEAGLARDASEVGRILAAGGIRTVSKAGACAFKSADGWAILQEAANAKGDDDDA